MNADRRKSVNLYRNKHMPAAHIISYMGREKIKYQSLRRLKKCGVLVFGKDILVEADCIISSGVELHSPCRITGATKIESGASIGAFSVIESSKIGEETKVEQCRVVRSSIGAHCTAGPFCYIRDGCEIGNDCRLGDFVEIKNSRLGDGCKAAHLAYIGDADLGERVNVGCGVVFANYDGKKKSRTTVGNRCFLGCNCNIVAPAHIGDGAYVAAGTTLSGEVESLSLAVGRSQLKIRSGGAAGRYLNG